MTDPLVVLTAHTGTMLCESFGDVQAYAEQVLGRPIFTHEFASQRLCDELREAIQKRGDFDLALSEIRAALAATRAAS